MPSTPPAEGAEDEPTPFSVFISQHAKGRTDSELAKAMQQVVQAVRESGKAGSITLKIGFKPLNDTALEITDSIIVKKPEGNRPKAIWFATDAGQLTRDDPHQMSFGFQENHTR